MEKVYLVECYKGSTVTDEETEEFVSGIFKTEKGAKEHVEIQINYWKDDMKVPKTQHWQPMYKKFGKCEHIQITYERKYISYWITERFILE